MRHRIVGVLALWLVLGAAARPAWAWHDRGHMAIALIAYRPLTDEQKNRIRQILLKHPHYEEFLAADRPKDAPLEEWVVMRAATWPDWIRTNHLSEGFNEPRHHYVNLPVLRREGATPQQIETIEKNIKAAPHVPSKGQLLREAPKRMAELLDALEPMEMRAIALCWVLHLVGDIHMPLHSSTLYTRDTLDGDRGGNASHVLWNNKVENLHSIWDGVLGWDEFEDATLTQYGVVGRMVAEFTGRHTIAPENVGNVDFEKWAKESNALADREVYTFKQADLPLAFDLSNPPKLKPGDVKPLPEGYVEQRKPIAESRIVQAGMRLNVALKNIP